ncbi:hypothetical protein NP493_220g01039 [Ridgeia piscesae]|uniref:Uncharacterized protein n=1 Tax=Ridgeia piscesae TaxID=27915 RepID=A0AAD9UDZ9_RIDPI|nr:hypothetical protein NP493_220g01039 [Ridgeia piscesae]
MADAGMTRDSEELQGACIGELCDTRGRGSVEGPHDTPWQIEGNYRDSITGDGSEARELGTMKLRRASAGSNFPKDYGRKYRRACHMNPRTEHAAEPLDEWKRLMSVKDAKETANTRGSGKTQKTRQVKRKQREKRPRRHWKKAREVSESDEDDDVALIVRQDGPVLPSGETEEDVADGAVSLTCIPESTLEVVTNGSQSQGCAIPESNDLCSKCTLEDTSCRTGKRSGW